MKNPKLVPFLIFIIIVLLSYGVYDKFFSVKLPVPQLTEKQKAALVSDVSEIMLLPDEKPEIAPIVNAEQLMLEQKFYTGSKDGDFIMVFPTAQRALIYRKSEHKLINVGPIFIDQPATTTKQSAPVEVKAATTTKATSTVKSENN